MKNSNAQMHYIVLGLTGVMGAVAVSVPIAMSRVSQTAKFAGQPFNSQTCETANPAQRQVTSWIETCRHLNTAPLPKPSPGASPAVNFKAAGIPSVVSPTAIAPTALPSVAIAPTALPSVAIVPSPVVQASPIAATSPVAIVSPVSTASPKSDDSNSLKLGMSGDGVTALQTKLQSAGVFSSVIDGVFGEDTETAVRNLQTQMKLESTGIADASLQAAIGTKLQ